MTMVDELAAFVEAASYEALSLYARQALKLRLLDSLGCALGALGGEPVRFVRSQVDDFGGRPLCTLIGGARTAPDRAALYNGALVRVLDFNDAYLAKGETCHPSDNAAAILAAAEYRGGTGRDFLTALAVAYQVECRLADLAPLRQRGFDHPTLAAIAAGAGVAKALGLDRARTAHAIALCATALATLRISRTGLLSHWKGLAGPFAAASALQCAFLASRGVTGPSEVFEGNKGFMQTVARPFTIDWGNENLERVRDTVLKRYDAEIHAQSVIEGILELRARHAVRPREIRAVELEIFDVAYKIIGGGEEGPKTTVRTKEQADHSLPYLVAVALLDGELWPEQFAPERIAKPDVQALLRRVTVRPSPALSRRFPRELACSIRLHLENGRTLVREKRHYEGWRTHPMRWETARAKFDRLARHTVEPELRQRITLAALELDQGPLCDLVGLLGLVGRAGERPAQGESTWHPATEPSPF